MLERFRKGFLKSLPAFGERNYRLHFLGQFPSTIGTWMQAATQGWLVSGIAHVRLGFWVGLIAAMMMLPSSLFGVFGGAIGDRFDLRKVMYVTQCLAMAQSFVLGILVLLGNVNKWEVLFLALFAGCVNAVDTPLRQAIIRQTVRRENIRSAVLINTAMVHSCLLIGPAIGGILILYVNVGWTFMLNGISFVAVCITLSRMRLPEFPKEHGAIITMVGEGIVHSFTNARIRVLLVLAFVVGMFGYPARTLFPLIAKDILHSNVTFTYLSISIGLGAILGACINAVAPKNWSPWKFIVGGSLSMGVGFISFACLAREHLWIALSLLFLAGMGFTFNSGIIRALVQFIVEAFMQSRTIAILITMFSAGVTGGSFLTGFLSDLLGPLGAIAVDGGVLLIIGFTLIPMRRKIAEFSTVH